MPKMKVDRILRSAPDGDALMVAPKDEQVIVMGTQGDFTQVRLVNVPGSPVGWVSSDSIDDTPAPAGPLDKRAFMQTCLRQGDIFTVYPHYLVAVAELRSRIRTDLQGSVGPYAFIQDEWDAMCGSLAYGFAFDAFQIADWTAQCIAFANSAHVVEEELTTLLGRRETATELYLAQIVGPVAAAALLTTPDGTAIDSLSAVAESERPAGGLSPQNILRRYDTLLGPTDTNEAAKGSLVLTRISQALRKALDDTSLLLPNVESRQLQPGTTLPPRDNVVTGAGDTIQSLAQQALDFFVKVGWTRAQALGLVANIDAESGFDVKAIGDKNLPSRAYGLFQWRLKRVLNFAGKYGKELREATFTEQLTYANFELRQGAETEAGKGLARQTSAAQAAKVVCSLYERPKDPNGLKAAKRAERAIEFDRMLT